MVLYESVLLMLILLLPFYLFTLFAAQIYLLHLLILSGNVFFTHMRVKKTNEFERKKAS